MGKLVWFVVVLAIAGALPVLFPGPAKVAMFKLMFRLKTAQLQYLTAHPDASALDGGRKVPSFEARAIEELLMMGRSQTDHLDLHGYREVLDSLGGMHGINEARVIPTTVGGLHKDAKAYWIYPDILGGHVAQAPVILFLHGGGYFSGSIQSHGSMAAMLCVRAYARALFVEYRLGPENPLPAAVEDAIASYTWLVNDQKVDPKRIVIAGDSAGGGLTLLTALAIQASESLPVPAALVTISPWTDLTLSSPSYKNNMEKDAMISVPGLRRAVEWAAGVDADHKLYSPLFADLKAERFPPLLTFVGTTEVLEDDTLLFVEKAKAAGIDVTLEHGHEMGHVWPIWFNFHEEAAQALNVAAQFIGKHTRINELDQ